MTNRRNVTFRFINGTSFSVAFPKQSGLDSATKISPDRPHTRGPAQGHYPQAPNRILSEVA